MVSARGLYPAPVAGAQSGCPKEVLVEVTGHLIFYLPIECREGSVARVRIPAGIRLGDLLGILGIPEGEVQVLLVNGETVTDSEHILKPGDAVVALPVIAGG